MNSSIPDFTDTDQALVASLLSRRYGKTVPLQLADSELQLDTAAPPVLLMNTSKNAPSLVNRKTCPPSPVPSGAGRLGTFDT
ncbi:hypothetical protein GALLN_00513 [Gallionellaceae bacterium]|nr:hypothetical protein GALLN_00513 [Gallionellaceae bacterium]